MIESITIGYLSRLKGIAKEVKRRLTDVAATSFELEPDFLAPPMEDAKAMLIYYTDLVSRIYHSASNERFLILCPFPNRDNLDRDAPLVSTFGKSDQWEILAKFRDDVRCPQGEAKACDLVYRVPVVVPVPGPTDIAQQIQLLGELEMRNVLFTHSANLTGHNDHLPADKQLDSDTIDRVLANAIKGAYSATGACDMLEAARDL